jgi:transposase-like protein
MTGRYERVEVITGVARRRRWSAEEKLRMVNELSRPGATVSLVARRNDINSSLLFKWRKLAREGAFGAPPDGDAGFVPVRLVPASATSAAPVAADDAAPAAAVNDANETSPVVEIVLPNGCRLRVPAEIAALSLHRLVTVLKRAV